MSHGLKNKIFINISKLEIIQYVYIDKEKS